jgi:hypothetical protein
MSSVDFGVSGCCLRICELWHLRWCVINAVIGNLISIVRLPDLPGLGKPAQRRPRYNLRRVMHPQSRFSVFAILLLLLSSANLYGIGLALLSRRSDSLTWLKARPDKVGWGTMAIMLLACSQVLYLAFLFAWLFQWMRFYPGNPAQTFSIRSGLSLSTAALLMAPLGFGLKRVIGIIVAISTGLLWLVAALGSVVA